MVKYENDRIVSPPVGNDKGAALVASCGFGDYFVVDLMHRAAPSKYARKAMERGVLARFAAANRYDEEVVFSKTLAGAMLAANNMQRRRGVAQAG